MSSILHQTPLGTARITETGGFISAISILDNNPDEEQTTSPVLKQATKQLDEYFAGTRKEFDFPIKQQGTDFQQMVWNELMNIGYAKTISYTQQSERMKNPLAIRAIAAANGKNNLWVVVPCHRVIGASGDLTGYAGGLWRKKWLLEHEAKVAGVGQTKLAF
ncbi:MAG: methylated-DNA--[protein]-cysteine S-methyltransferase [Mucilaginibacter sp.]|uniref:methylated-DNA--[protein]-cysteine S-methyltransferase n=1 Tax=Mucilaginibacter sp. TaxID=1882438 RepID=UPI003266C20B